MCRKFVLSEALTPPKHLQQHSETTLKRYLVIRRARSIRIQSFQGCPFSFRREIVKVFSFFAKGIHKLYLGCLTNKVAECGT